MEKKLLKNSKGFTLVELIIVIAIIAILVAVLAPQYLQYVERARETNDLSTASTLIDAAVLAASDPEVDLGEGNNGVQITWYTSDSGTAKGVGVNAAVIGDDGQAKSTEASADATNAVQAIVGTLGEVSTPESTKGLSADLVVNVDRSTGSITLQGSATGNWVLNGNSIAFADAVVEEESP